ncbi:MAG: 50S ribosomal protein L40e [Candidatus Diapherotrites archaeon]|nr:50S ribosomal protein L40e [Candidatus Diapherotrites archaeon]
MADFKESIARRFSNVYVCQRCNATNRSNSGVPANCRKCESHRLRLKKKKKKTAA